MGLATFPSSRDCESGLACCVMFVTVVFVTVVFVAVVFVTSAEKYSGQTGSRINMNL